MCKLNVFVLWRKPIGKCSNDDKNLTKKTQQGFQIRRLSDFESGHVPLRDLWPDLDRLRCLDYSREILGEMFHSEIEAPESAAGQGSGSHSQMEPADSMVNLVPAKKEDKLARVKAVPGFHYDIKPNHIPTEEELDELKRHDKDFWKTFCIFFEFSLDYCYSV